MRPPLDELYFNWLYSQVDDRRIKHPSRTYWRLCKLMYTREFLWSVPNDDNRIEDGKELRYEFVDNERLMDVDIGWMRLGCSMLELLVALSRRLHFVTDVEPRLWFWRLVENLSLRGYTDNKSYADMEVIDILDAVIWRTYSESGEGGLFPLRNAQQDQRRVEIWYQMNAYVLELEEEGRLSGLLQG